MKLTVVLWHTVAGGVTFSLAITDSARFTEV